MITHASTYMYTYIHLYILPQNSCYRHKKLIEDSLYGWINLVHNSIFLYGSIIHVYQWSCSQQYNSDFEVLRDRRPEYRRPLRVNFLTRGWRFTSCASGSLSVGSISHSSRDQCSVTQSTPSLTYKISRYIRSLHSQAFFLILVAAHCGYM